MSRKASNRQIFDKSSLTNQLVTITCNLRDRNVEGLEELNALVKSQILFDCAYYSESLTGETILCNSGELDGRMLVPQGCNRCVVGQFSLSGKFLGELTPDNNRASEDSSIF